MLAILTLCSQSSDAVPRPAAYSWYCEITQSTEYTCPRRCSRRWWHMKEDIKLSIVKVRLRDSIVIRFYGQSTFPSSIYFLPLLTLSVTYAIRITAFFVYVFSSSLLYSSQNTAVFFYIFRRLKVLSMKYSGCFTNLQSFMVIVKKYMRKIAPFP